MGIVVNYIPDLQSEFKRSKHAFKNVRTKWKLWCSIMNILILMNILTEVSLCCDEKMHLLAHWKMLAQLL